jgi:DNA polymerase-3 subunit delta
MSRTRPLVALVKGEDPSLVRDAVRAVVDEAVGDGDRALLVDDYGDDDYELAAVVDAAQTPPMLTSYRVVVARGLDRFGLAALAPLLGYLADPLDSTTLVLVWGPAGSRVPKALADALKAAGGETVNASVPTGRGRQEWIDAEVSGSGLRLDAAARRLLAEQLADDVARLPSVLEALASSFGPGAQLGPAEVGPLLGEAGAVPPWELTDAIDKGDAALALAKLGRMVNAGGRHPLQVMVTLHAHFERMLSLHGAAATNEAQAATVLGLKGSTFPARKALTRLKALGPARLSRAMLLLADADLGLRGQQGWPPEQVLEVLVARLARLSR